MTKVTKITPELKADANFRNHWEATEGWKWDYAQRKGYIHGYQVEYRPVEQKLDLSMSRNEQLPLTKEVTKSEYLRLKSQSEAVTMHKGKYYWHPRSEVQKQNEVRGVQPRNPVVNKTLGSYTEITTDNLNVLARIIEMNPLSNVEVTPVSIGRISGEGIIAGAGVKRIKAEGLYGRIEYDPAAVQKMYRKIKDKINPFPKNIYWPISANQLSEKEWGMFVIEHERIHLQTGLDGGKVDENMVNILALERIGRRDLAEIIENHFVKGAKTGYSAYFRRKPVEPLPEIARERLIKISEEINPKIKLEFTSHAERAEEVKTADSVDKIEIYRQQVEKEIGVSKWEDVSKDEIVMKDIPDEETYKPES